LPDASEGDKNECRSALTHRRSTLKKTIHNVIENVVTNFS